MQLVRERAGRAFDPVAACLIDHADEILALDEQQSAWEEMFAREPSRPLVLAGAGSIARSRRSATSPI